MTGRSVPDLITPHAGCHRDISKTTLLGQLLEQIAVRPPHHNRVLLSVHGVDGHQVGVLVVEPSMLAKEQTTGGISMAPGDGRMVDRRDASRCDYQ